MDCEEIRVDIRKTDPQDRKEGQRCAKLLFQLNHTMPYTEEYSAVLRELFGENLGEGSIINPPLSGACISSMKIGKHVLINSNLLAMARGGITIEDHAMIAANVQLISNNHDPYDLMVLPCKPVLIKESAWIGAGATVSNNLQICGGCMIGAGAVVIKSITESGTYVGVPAEKIK